MRSPAQHPSRGAPVKAGIDLELDLDPGAPPASGTTPRSSASGRGVLGGSRAQPEAPGSGDALDLDLGSEEPESARRPVGPPAAVRAAPPSASEAMASLDDDVGSLDVGLDLGAEPVSAVAPTAPESGTRAAPKPIVASPATSRSIPAS